MSEWLGLQEDDFLEYLEDAEFGSRKPYEVLHGVRDRLRYHASYLQKLSDAFSMVGNAEMARNMAFEAVAIDSEADLMNKAIGRWIDKEYLAAQTNTASLLNAAMAGVIGKGGE